jgi:predicted deacylase
MVTLDLDGSGKQLGEIVFPLQAPWCGNDRLVLPACVIANGEGPTLALLGGNHGDEYEGPLVLGQLIRELDADAVQGRLMILPAINPPALLARSRDSPLDGKNLNRIWPGDASGTPTERIVAWLDREVLSRTDVLMDLHTGGDALELIPMSMCHYTEDPARRARIRAAQEAFNAPLSVELRLAPGRATAAGRAHDRGLLVVGSESGGGGVVHPASLANCYEGVRNVLDHLRVLPLAPAPGRRRVHTRFSRKWGHEAEMRCDRPGVFVPFHRLWDRVEAGGPAGQLVQVHAPTAPPQTLVFPASGLIAGRRARSGVAAGDVLYWIVQDLEESED